MSKVSHLACQAQGRFGVFPTLHSELAVASAGPLALAAALNCSKGATQMLYIIIAALAAIMLAVLIIAYKDEKFEELEAWSKSQARLRKILGGSK